MNLLQKLECKAESFVNEMDNEMKPLVSVVTGRVFVDRSDRNNANGRGEWIVEQTRQIHQAVNECLEKSRETLPHESDILIGERALS
jgi:predicted RNA-binding protein YlxR (DUF448 family)